MLLLLCFITLAVADVAIVQFSQGALRGNIRFSQEDGLDDVSIVSNIQDISGNLGSKVDWNIHNGYVNVSNSETCEQNGDEVWNPNKISGSLSCSATDVAGTCALGNLVGYLGQLVLGHTTVHTKAFSVSDLFGLTLVLGDEVGCVGIDETPEALRLTMEARWDSAVGEDTIDQVEAILIESFNSTLGVSVEFFYPVHATGTLTDVPTNAATTNEDLTIYLHNSLSEILGLKSFETLEVTVIDNNDPTIKNVSFIVTSYSSGTHIFHHNSIKFAGSFASQVADGVNLAGAVASDTVWESDFVVTSVDLKTTIVQTTTDVSEGTDVGSDIQAQIPDLTKRIEDIEGTVENYSIIVETRNPTSTPSSSPTTPMPSVAPTAIPSDFPSTVPSSAPSCSLTQHDYLGDPLISVVEDQSVYSSENGTMQITVGWPSRYSVVSIDLAGDTAGTYDLTTLSDGLWTSYEAQNCLVYYSVLITWSEVVNGAAGIQWKGSTNSFDGRVDVALQESFEKTGSSSGNTFSRDVSLQMPFSIQLRTSIVVPHTLEIEVADALLTSKVLTGLTVVSPNGKDPAEVSTTFITQVPFPWVLNEKKFTIVDHNGLLVSGTETLSVTASENCNPNALNVDCKQYWLASWDSNSVCYEQGNVTLSITAEYTQVPPYVDEEVIDVTMTVSLLPSCVQTVSTLAPGGSLTLYTDSSLTSDSLIFYIDEEVWGQILLETKQPVYSIELNSLTVEQDGNLKNIRTDAFEYAELSRVVGTTSKINFQARLSIDELEGKLTGKATVLRADVTVAYEDGERRRLEVSLGELKTSSHMETTLVILDDSPCFNPKTKVGDFNKIACDESENEFEYQLCENSGWRTISECSSQNDQQVDVVLEEAEQKDASNTSPWMIASVVLVAGIIILGIILYKCLLSSKSKYEFTTIQA